MGVALITWGRFFDKHGNKITVPAPSTSPGVPWLLDWLAAKAPDLRRAGFSALQLPPTSKAQGGAGDGCDGYGVFDIRDIGSKNQQGSIPTRYGPAESLRRLIAVAHSVGLDVYLDVVLHQLMGENGGPGVFRYLGSDGKTLNGRGTMSPGCFRGGTGNNDPIPPFRPEDAVPVPFYDYPFGREKVYQNSAPPGHTINDALDYGDWLFKTTGADGMRFDDTKGTWAPFVSQFMRSRAMAGKFAYSEYFDGNPGNLNYWATAAPMNSRSLVEDFTLHWALQSACDGGNARALDRAGYIVWNSFLSCTFVDNPDTDTSPGQQIISNKGLAYAFLLSMPGYPFVYGKDYFPSSVWPGAYGLQPLIDNLIWIHENLAFGNAVTQFLDDKVIVLNRTGSPGLLTALNFDTWNHRTITCPTSFGPHVQLHDYTGRHPDIWTDAGGRATFTIPNNGFNRGQSFLCFSRTGYGQPFSLNGRSTTQVFFGASDLDIPPAKPGATETVARIDCAAHTAVAMEFHPEVEGSYKILALDAQNKHMPVKLEGSGKNYRASATVPASGWLTLQVESAATNKNISPYALSVTYHAPQRIAG
jgi:alpha-amylase